jgi:hypothetical protein
MKLNEYIFKEMIKIQNARPADRPQMWPSGIYFTPKEIEKWIVEWYESEFNWQGKKKRPPMWLADWREPERSVIEQERCGIDEG